MICEEHRCRREIQTALSAKALGRKEHGGTDKVMGRCLLREEC